MVWVSERRSEVVGRFLTWPPIFFQSVPSPVAKQPLFHHYHHRRVQRHFVFQRDCCCVENIVKVHEGNICIDPAFFKEGVYSILNFTEFGRFRDLLKELIGSRRSTTRQQRRHQFCIFNAQKQNVCTPFTCYYYFCTFLFRSRQICDVKTPFLKF